MPEMSDHIKTVRRIRAMLVLQGLSYINLAAMLECSPEHLSRVVRGHYEFGDGKTSIARIAGALGVEVEVLTDDSAWPKWVQLGG